MPNASAPLNRMAIHTITTKPWSLKECIANYQARKVPGITVWRQSLAPQGPKESAKRLQDSGLSVVALVRGGFFTGKTAAERQKAIDDNLLALDEASTIGAPLIVLVCGATPGQPLSESRKQILDGLQHLAPHYKARGVRLTIEPLHPMYAADRSAVLTMKHAGEICAQFNDELPGPGCGRKLVGIAVDVYHVWWDETLSDEIARAGREGWLHALHVCDWRVQTRELLNDRGLMGEGCINIRQIRDWVEKAGFDGWIEVEIFSTERWAGDQQVWLDQIIKAYRDHV
jgi:sugar phosphate isomerase/epimerase